MEKTKVIQQLHRAFRPSKFSDVIGQDSQKKILQGHLSNNACPQAVLFSGPSGVGKTTLARIVAKVLNCKDVSKDFEPCDKCPSCLDIKNEAFTRNILMIDCGTNRGVAQMEPLKADINSYPMYGDKYKVIIFDEAHMLTETVFNSFLTTIEEPPPHVFFFFCTTEPSKVLKTVRTRCIPIKLGSLKDQEVAVGMARILSNIHGRTLTRSEMLVLKRIADISFGCLREALNSLQTLLYCDALTPEKAEEFLPKVTQNNLTNCINWIFSKNPEILTYIDSLTEQKDFDSFFLQMRAVLKNVVIAKLNGNLIGQDWIIRAATTNANRVSAPDLAFLVELFNVDTTRFFSPRDYFFSKFATYLLNNLK